MVRLGQVMLCYVMLCYVMLFPAKISIIFGISTSNNAGIIKIYSEKQVALHSLTFTEILVRALQSITLTP